MSSLEYSLSSFFSNAVWTMTKTFQSMTLFIRYTWTDKVGLQFESFNKKMCENF